MKSACTRLLNINITINASIIRICLFKLIIMANVQKRIVMVKECIEVLACRYANTCVSCCERNNIRQKIIKLMLVIKELKKREKIRKKRSVWVRPAFTLQQRLLQGDGENLLVLLQNDPSLYFNYLRMDIGTFELLHTIVGPLIEKQNAIREPIPSITRLQICLRYLATGDSMRSVGYAFRCAPNTVSKIVKETCKIIWSTLKDVVLPQPTKDSWLKVAADFEDNWDFTHCIGAIDGKHIEIQAPADSGSYYFNYKKRFSINFTAVSDAHYQFILIDIGKEGRRSDAGVFADSKIKLGFENNSLDVPEPSAPANSLSILPFVLVGDEAYPLTNYLMRPYPRSSILNIKKKVFNYRLSRARRIIENAFGILSGRWRIYRKPINTYVSNVETIVLATVCLHNFIIRREMEMPGAQKRYTRLAVTEESLGLTCIEQIATDKLSKNLPNIYRDRFTDYFMTTGAVSWQWEKAITNAF